jgi:hypothetical protein
MHAARLRVSVSVSPQQPSGSLQHRANVSEIQLVTPSNPQYCGEHRQHNDSDVESPPLAADTLRRQRFWRSDGSPSLSHRQRWLGHTGPGVDYRGRIRPEGNAVLGLSSGQLSSLMLAECAWLS